MAIDKQHIIDEIIFAVSKSDLEKMEDLLLTCEEQGVRIVANERLEVASELRPHALGQDDDARPRVGLGIFEHETFAAHLAPSPFHADTRLGAGQEHVTPRETETLTLAQTAIRGEEHGRPVAGLDGRRDLLHLYQRRDPPLLGPLGRRAGVRPDGQLDRRPQRRGGKEGRGA